jgi:hypothetical protein
MIGIGISKYLNQNLEETAAVVSKARTILNYTVFFIIRQLTKNRTFLLIRREQTYY